MDANGLRSWPYARTGTTSEDNLIPLSRRWHRAKTLGGYRYDVDAATGEITWTTPLGQQASTSPYDYRLGP